MTQSGHRDTTAGHGRAVGGGAVTMATADASVAMAARRGRRFGLTIRAPARRSGGSSIWCSCKGVNGTGARALCLSRSASLRGRGRPPRAWSAPYQIRHIASLTSEERGHSAHRQTHDRRRHKVATKAYRRHGGAEPGLTMIIQNAKMEPLYQQRGGGAITL